MPIAGFPLIKIGDIYRERNDLSSAEDYINRGIDFSIMLNQPDVLIESYICLARLRISQNDLPGTLEALEKAEHVLIRNKVDPWCVGWLDDCWTRYWLSIRDIDSAISRIKKSGLMVDSPLDYHHNLHHINLARVLIAQGVENESGPFFEEAENLLSRLYEAAKKAEWVHETINISILMGLLFFASGKNERSIEAITRALALAEPGGYVRRFVDEGKPMEDLLSCFLMSNRAKKGKSSPYKRYAEKLLKALKNERLGNLPIVISEMSNIIEPLSVREMEVLHYLNTHLSSTEIGQELAISSNTVRFHIKNIYSKLNVNRRAEAIQSARKLGIL